MEKFSQEKRFMKRKKNKEVQKEQQHDEEIVIQRDMESGEYFEKANIYRANNGSSSFQTIKQQQRKAFLDAVL
ncbi:hypothetical protein DAPPUDRAFT_247812 [Daphnia pulex]|uniref:Uncharacterized protein n=1 Tax=Daphnia pulex TaxID=6669 RepID=E9GSX6_DAPPU|nr:hypothetical protein DAPPUDRAFT_247812 [Daphnia pulex]|eukprot:EFX77368.1 hypothetical protein DAPPUDRAFT_247812 [Daphnia pulex]